MAYKGLKASSTAAAVHAGLASVESYSNFSRSEIRDLMTRPDLSHAKEEGPPLEVSLEPASQHGGYSTLLKGKG